MFKSRSTWCFAAIACVTAVCLWASAAEEEKRPLIFGQFTAWTENFLKATDPDQRAALEKAGEALVTQRRAAMTNLIQSAPQRALELAVPDALRRQLPVSITQSLEHHVGGRGDLNVLVADDFERGKSETRRTVTIQGRTYRAFVYGKRLDQASQQNVPLRGIVLDGLMAVQE